MDTKKTINAIASATTLVTSLALPVDAEAKGLSAGPARTVVLVHGAFADGTCWQRVIPLLQKAGLKVIAVQNPLDALENDVASTHRALDLAEGPVVLVGHCWGGVVITEAGVHEKVKALVYIAAFVPDVGQSVMDIRKMYPDPPAFAFIEADQEGFLKFSDEGVFEHFAAGLPHGEQQIVAATQGSLSSLVLQQPLTKAAWRELPTFVLVTTNDTIASPTMQRDQVEKMLATCAEIASGHLAMLSHPEAVAKLILNAAK